MKNPQPYHQSALAGEKDMVGALEEGGTSEGTGQQSRKLGAMAISERESWITDRKPVKQSLERVKEAYMSSGSTEDPWIEEKRNISQDPQ